MHKLTITSFGLISIVVTLGCTAPASSGTEPIIVISQACNIDSVEGKEGNTFSPTRGRVDVAGWVGDSTSNSASGSVSVQIVSQSGAVQAQSRTTERIGRPDVASSLKQAGYGQSGFKMTLDLSALAPGDYSFSIVQSTEKKWAVCQVPKRLSVRG